MQRNLRFREDGTFRILQLTDIHYSEGNEADRRTIALMRDLIRRENPDFIMTTGDTVVGKRIYEVLEEATAPITESNIPWSYVFGNHDVEDAGTREELFSKICTLPGCIAWDDPKAKDGVGNHTIGIEDADGNVKWLIVGVDSGDYNPIPGIGGYGYVTTDQIQWYREQIRRQESEGADFGVMIFQHIPLPEHEEVHLYETTYGMKKEECCPPKINTGFFAAILQSGHSPSVFVGHDHVNDYYGNMFGVTLGFGRATGYGTYGAMDHARGGRVFVLSKDNITSYDTYVSLEGGLVVHEPWSRRPLERREDE